MNEQAINPIQSLLNELASIANSEQTAQTVEQMERTKSLAARLYLELDFAIMESQAPSDAELDEWVAQVEHSDLSSPEEQKPDSSVTEPDLSVPVEELPTVVSVEMVTESIGVEPVSSGSLVEAISETENETAIEERVEEEAVVIAETADLSAAAEPETAETTGLQESAPAETAEMPNQEQEIDADAILMSLSMSRRFEFANFLFGGDMARFRLFITEFVRAGTPGSAQVFERWYTECDWKRKDESASDLLRNLKRLV